MLGNHNGASLYTWFLKYLVVGLSGGYRCLNDAVVPDRYPVPKNSGHFCSPCGDDYFLQIDLIRVVYHQIPVDAEEIHKTAINAPFCLYEYLRMLFSLKNAQAFQWLRDTVCHDHEFALSLMI